MGLSQIYPGARTANKNCYLYHTMYGPRNRIVKAQFRQVLTRQILLHQFDPLAPLAASSTGKTYTW